ncbi:type VI secretion system baseplate subunit TssK [Pseudomonas putida]
MANAQVFWGQGAFLTPQHLQQQDAWLQDYSLRLHRHFSPYPSGFCTLRLNAEGLDNGVFDILKFSLLSRTGEWITGGSQQTDEVGNAHLPERTLTSLAVSSAEPISLFLVLAQDKQLGGLQPSPAPATADSGLPARHGLRSDRVSDPYDVQAAEADVDYLVYQLRIVTSLDENAESLLRDCEAFKVAEILPNGPGRYRLSNDFIPACTAMAASTVLSRWTRNLHDLLRSRGNDFAALKRQRGIRAASTSAQEVMRVLMMQTFARYIPLLAEMVRLESVCPWALYLDLRRLVAEFSVFSEDVGYCGELRGQSDKELPTYDHHDLRYCFSQVFARAESLIKALTVGAEVGITLAHDGHYYKADLSPALFESDKTRFYLAFECDLRGVELADRLQRTGKIASLDEMPRLLQAALFGLKIDLLAVAPEELPQRSSNTTYFMIDTHHAFWQLIRERRSIAVFTDLSPDSLVIKLFPVQAQE